jgi:predicted RecA/RadA family phage recombinase
MAVNQVLEQGGAQPLQVAITPSLVLQSGTPVLVGQMAGVMMTSNPPMLQPGTLAPLMLPSTGFVTILLAGVFMLPVTAKTGLSPSVGSAVNPGDKIYADGGTTTSDGSNLTYGFTLDKNSGGTLFGSAVSVGGAAGPLLASSASGQIAVRLKEGA